VLIGYTYTTHNTTYHVHCPVKNQETVR